MLKLIMGVALLLVNIPSGLAQQSGKVNYAANYANCMQDLSSPTCNRDLLTEAELYQVINKDQLSRSSQAPQSNSRKILSQSSSRSRVAKGETVTIIPGGPTVNQNSGQTVHFFRRGEVPPNYSGDYIEYDDPNASSTNSQPSQNSTPVDQNYGYRTKPSSYGQPNDFRTTTRSENTPRNDATSSMPENQTSKDSELEFALGLIVAGLSLFVVIWLLKLVFKGARKMVSVTTQGVNSGVNSSIGSVGAELSANSEFSPIKAYVAALWIMTLIGLAGFSYPYYVILRLGFILAFIVAIMANRRQNRSIYPNIKWPYVGIAIYVFVWGLPLGLWVVIDIVFLVWLYRMFWQPERTTKA